MINLIKMAKEQNGVITLEQLNDALKELENIVDADKPKWYDDGNWHQTTIYDGESYLLNKILKANKL
jgi:hypothetical protein